MAAAMATTRPPKEMAIPAAAPVASGTAALLAALTPEAAAEVAEARAEEPEATAPVLLTTMTVELTPTMGVARDETGATGVAVASAVVAGVVAGLGLVYTAFDRGDCDEDVPAGAEDTPAADDSAATEVAVTGAWIWPSLIWEMTWTWGTAATRPATKATETAEKRMLSDVMWVVWVTWMWVD